MAGGFLSLTALRAEGCGLPLCGNAYKVSVTGFTFSVIWYDKHSADWLAAFASPYPAAPDFPLCRGQNKTPRNTLFINGSTVSTGYSAPVEVLHGTSKWGEVRRLACPLRRFPFAAPPNCGGGKGTGFIGELQATRESSDMLPTGQGGGASHQRGIAFPRPSGRLYGFIQTGAFYNLEAPYNNPRARGASNLNPLRTFGPTGRQPSHPKGACPPSFITCIPLFYPV